MTATGSISESKLNRLLYKLECPVLVDTRRKEPLHSSDKMIASAKWRDHQQAAKLRSVCIDALFIEGGIDAFFETYGETVTK